MKRPFGYFVHHQGRGHAERAAAIAHALPASRPLTLFSARDDIFPDLPDHAQIVLIPSLFEPSGAEIGSSDWVGTPETLHCAPLGWPGIRHAMATMTAWFHEADPALMICDVSAEVAQLARICSVPHVKVLQHGQRSDPGHRAAYDGAAGLLAAFHADLAQPDWGEAMRAKTCFVGGLGVETLSVEREVARQRIGIGRDTQMILVVSGGGGGGFAQAPLGVGARTRPDAQWITIGPVQRDWHATEPANIEHRGWVDNAVDYIAAADIVISSTGNTTCQQVLEAGRPWLAVPEWRYFDEQHCKADALGAAGAACIRPHLPSSAQAWQQALDDTLRSHRPDIQRAMIESEPARIAADWLEALSERLWPNAEPTPTATAAFCPPLMEPQ